MTVKEFIAKLKDIEKNYKTVYGYAMFGHPITQKNINDKAKQNLNNWYTNTRIRHLESLIGKNYFGFDCVNLIKGILWGWTGDKSKAYGGATYNSNGVPDVSADGFIQRCKTTGTNFSDIKVGDVVWMKGHIGVYIGNGLAIECTPRWANGVQTTAVLNIGSKAGYNGRTWTKWGRNPYIDYGGEKVAKDYTKHVMYGRVLKFGAKGDDVGQAQRQLKAWGYYTGPIDNEIGPGQGFVNAIKAFQKANALDPDGSIGPATQKKMAELLQPPTTDYKKLYESEKAKRELAEKKLATVVKDIKTVIGNL